MSMAISKIKVQGLVSKCVHKRNQLHCYLPVAFNDNFFSLKKKVSGIAMLDTA